MCVATDPVATAHEPAAEGRAGTLRIGYETPIMRDGLAESIRAFRAEVPDAALDFWEAGSREQAEAVREGRADVGLVLLPVDERGLEVRTLGAAPSVAVVPEGHRLAGRETVALAVAHRRVGGSTGTAACFDYLDH